MPKTTPKPDRRRRLRWRKTGKPVLEFAEAPVRGSFRSFEAAEDFFRDKVNVPTTRWDQLWQGQHARAFVVAGATKDELLKDLREAVDAAISQGETLADFRKRFDELVGRHGWTGWKGEESVAGRAWRTRLIYNQNLRSAYNAGRWETLRKFPYLRYNHHTVNNPREQHQAWDGLIVRTDSAWVRTHYPPNGFGCACDMTGISEARFRRGDLTLSDPPADSGDVPEAFAYNVGEAHLGKLLSEQDMQMWRDRKADAWEVLTPRTAAEFGRPETVPIDPLPTPLPELRGNPRAALRPMLLNALGGETREFALQVRPDFAYRIVASVDVLEQHIDPARARVVPLLPEIIERPFEVWQSFERHRGTGRVVLRTRYIRAFEIPGLQGMLVVLEATKGQLVTWTLIPARLGYVERQRYGELLYGRGDAS